MSGKQWRYDDYGLVGAKGRFIYQVMGNERISLTKMLTIVSCPGEIENTTRGEHGNDMLSQAPAVTVMNSRSQVVNDDEPRSITNSMPWRLFFVIKSNPIYTHIQTEM